MTYRSRCRAVAKGCLCRVSVTVDIVTRGDEQMLMF